MSDTVLAQAKAAPTYPLGLYVHVPFCASTCDFCAFYQVKPTSDDVTKFLSGIEREAEQINWSRPVTTVFWGGGTPGLLSPAALQRLGDVVRQHCDEQLLEWTVEMTPASVTEARLHALKDMGVTRISMGVQSFQPQLLDALGRQHSLEQIHRAYDRVRKADFKSVNIDLMFALPGQTESEWATDVAEAVALEPDHISTYCLTFEEDTALWVKLFEGRVKLDPEREAQLYESTWARLAEAGYEQYEIANFARPRHICQHNLNTWQMHEWIGLGPSAASQHNGWRGGNVADLRQWLAGIEQHKRMTEDLLALTPTQLAEDALIFGLRMNAGVDLEIWHARAPAAPWEEVDRRIQSLTTEGLAHLDGQRLCLTERGRLLADAVGLEMMEAFQEVIPV